jgi:MFS family permease
MPQECKECASTIEWDGAVHCPYCGAPIRQSVAAAVGRPAATSRIVVAAKSLLLGAVLGAIAGAVTLGLLTAVTGSGGFMGPASGWILISLIIGSVMGAIFGGTIGAVVGVARANVFGGLLIGGALGFLILACLAPGAAISHEIGLLVAALVCLPAGGFIGVIVSAVAVLEPEAEERDLGKQASN